MKTRKRKGGKPPKYNPLRVFLLVFAALAAVVLLFAGVNQMVHVTTQPPAPASETTESQASLASSTSQEPASSEVSSQTTLADLSELKATLQYDLNSIELEDLEAQINAYLDEHHIDRAKISWSVQDLTTDAVILSDNATANFTAASTYKLPLAVYYYEQIAAGAISPSDTLEYTQEMEEKEDAENLNQPIHRKYAVGDKIPIDELLEAALLYSDNIAGHMLYENLGGYSRFKEIIAAYGTGHQTSDFYAEDVNVLNAQYAMELMHHIYNTTGTFNELKWWLQNAAVDSFLNRSLYGTYIQKVGNLGDVRNAIAISNGAAPFSLSIFTNISKEEGQNLLDDLGVICYNYFANKYASGFYDGTDQTRISTLNAQMTRAADVVNTRPGPNGQTIRELTSEEEKMIEEANQ